MKINTGFNRYIYWIDEKTFNEEMMSLRKQGFKLSAALKTPCETLNAQDNKIFYARSQIWSRVCVRQGSWYRQSKKAGKVLMVSEKRLPTNMDNYLDAELSSSDFRPDNLPSVKQLLKLVDSKPYQEHRPDEWEKPGIKDKLMFKTLFSITGFWGRGDNLHKHWLNHRANHANFLSRKFTTDIEGQRVPYSVTENSGVCSSCVEFFNLVSQDSRKLVAACPGSITFSKVERNIYYDVKPVKIPIVEVAV